MKNKNIIKTISYTSLFWLFMLGSVLGFMLEGIWCVFRKGRWENHSATVWGPFCIIYGIGTIVVYLLAGFLETKPPLLQFFCYMLAGGLVEYVASVFQELSFGSVSWDYSSHVMNLGGRVSLKMSLIWGFLGLAFTHFMFQPLQSFFAGISSTGNTVICVVLTGFMAINLLITSAALLRWGKRIAGVPPKTRVDEWMDQWYVNSKMEKIYCNMRFVKDT